MLAEPSLCSRLDLDLVLLDVQCLVLHVIVGAPDGKECQHTGQVHEKVQNQV